MHIETIPKHISARRIITLGALFGYIAFSGLGCPDSSGSGTSDVGIAPITRSFAYVTNAGDNTVSTYTIDPTTGDLTPSGTTKTGQRPIAATTIAASNLGYAVSAQVIGFLYVVNQNDNSISQFEYDTSGKLTPLSPATVATGRQPAAIVFSLGTADTNSNGNTHHVFVANKSDNSVTDYNVGSDGTLTLNHTSPCLGTQPVSITADNFGVCVLNAGDKSICQLAYGLGDLTSRSKIQLPASYVPMGIIEPLNALYLIDSGQNTISQYLIDPTLIAQKAAAVAGTPISEAVDNFASKNTYQESTIGVYVVTSTGLIYQYEQTGNSNHGPITPLTAAPVSLPAQQIVIKCIPDSVDPGTTHKLYALLGSSNTIRVYSTANIALGSVPISDNPTGKNPSDIAIGTVTVSTATVQTTVKSAKRKK